MKKFRVLQIGLLISIIGLTSFKVLPLLGLSEKNISSISNIFLILIVLTWVSTYFFRVISGKMTFMEQRKRYRKEYEKVLEGNLQDKFNSLSVEEQKKLLQELEDK